MLFRRFAENLARQNWPAIVIEFVIVVAGVFVGIQVSNWNADRVDHRRAHGYLQRIRADVLADQQSMTNNSAYWNHVIAFGQTSMAYADSGRLAGDSKWKTLVAFYQASQMLPFRVANSTYQEVVSSGDLGLLGDDRLRAALAKYYVTGPLPGTPYILQFVPEYRTLVRGATPDAISSYIWKHCVVNTGGLAEELSDDCASPITEAEAQAVLDGYVATPGLLPALRFWVTNQRVGVALLGSVRDDSNELLREVETALKE